MQFTAYEVICASVYGHWPEAVTTLELAQVCALIDGRDPDDAMRACAAKIAYRTKDKQLQGILLTMVIAEYPSNILLSLDQRVGVMLKNLRKNGGELFEYDSHEAMKLALKKPRLSLVPTR
ncbi:hypothetical protein FROZEN_36 [Erwinia phage vB_EamP_Frozen]|uniref:DUF7740 domain-containing protein n=1 Tax=Erwinia phage vB_EamP_Frozen TaxID=1852641 RepID=A0A191ZCP7_9CAUD|nr:hypothetical protein FROZEN_36 [Erwinia phage vB_EamP_Frozen]ANJ65167.1 hypothetical protein FROZEN_36 [Erwinia phage vB_EamP_Frozen]